MIEAMENDIKNKEGGEKALALTDLVEFLVENGELNNDLDSELRHKLYNAIINLVDLS